MDLAATGMTLPWFRKWQHPACGDAFWQQPLTQPATTLPERATAPMFFIGGWSDTFVGAPLDAWQALSTQEQSALVIGPLHHLSHLVSDVTLLGLENPELGLERSYGLLARKIHWVRPAPRGAQARWGAGTWTCVFGGDRWEAAASWPPPTREERWHLAPSNAVGRHAVLTRGRTTGTASWRYDPTDPTPSLGGAGLLGGALRSSAPPSRASATKGTQEREDLLGWRAPLSTPRDFRRHDPREGPCTHRRRRQRHEPAVLERRADNTLLHLRQDSRALSSRDGGETFVAYVPDESVPIELETWALHHELQTSSRLVVQLASASFPKFEAHANTAVPVPWDEAVDTGPATLTVDLSETWVALPVVE